MTIKNGDMPAMPITLNDGEYFRDGFNGDGLTKREMFAMAAMQGLLSKYGANVYSSDIANSSINYADALLHELEHTK